MLTNRYTFLVVANGLNPTLFAMFLSKISVSKSLNHVSRDLQIMAGGPESLRRLGTWWAISMSCIVRFFPPI